MHMRIYPALSIVPDNLRILPSLIVTSWSDSRFLCPSADDTVPSYLSLIHIFCEAYGKPCEGKCDADILLGGFRMECEEKGIVVDETFDTGIDEQKDWFYTNSGLFIK